ncbi:hypothetical protein JH06_2904 [Blastocystis sp. subtype 4]|uniref:hypothetical protein n=1 Tax=Blastocystis sp. subtype 4 TaxID=944170 RepID=UPI0007116FF5|nr:hypothetical protein JH06_2904 [Blastocystis sp. subtype 4]KNB43750.1 hypothetical protein JH06_2904 [Blastocystis sp. subtype 4]|eukprot:XP_014527193.1 hypothetical protein JH06_2904 [Blastocystis sp. subtype 4]
MLRNRDLDNREDGVLYVDEYVSSRTQDVYLHYPVLETPLVQRDLRRRATSNLKQPSYYGNKKKQYSPSTDPNTRLLPLHAWNAKRMKMRRMWGWYLPYVDNQHESVSRCATVHDSSYYEIISVYGCLDNSLRKSAYDLGSVPICLLHWTSSIINRATSVGSLTQFRFCNYAYCVAFMPSIDFRFGVFCFAEVSCKFVSAK